MKVLVADDENSTRELLAKWISSWDYQVVLAKDGNEAWEILNDKDPPRIALLDWIMPGKTGIEICSECEKKQKVVYRILVTARDNTQDLMYALDHGAHDFQSKPIVPGILKSRLAVGKRAISGIENVIQSERLAAVGLLVTGVAHHFNNLNLPILLYASSILRSDNPDPVIRKKVEKIEKAAEQAGSLTEKLMAIASNKKIEKKPIDFNRLVTDVIDIESIWFEKERITVERDLNPLPEIYAFETDIRHVVMNIIKNACEAMLEQPEKTITIKTGSLDQNVYLEITDTGLGIAREKLKNIFSLFYTEKGAFSEPDSPFSRIQGRGIGLYSAKSIAVEHGGDITVQSELGKGSTFTLLLPKQKEV